jgi:hypothetical protein
MSSIVNAIFGVFGKTLHGAGESIREMKIDAEN